MRQRGKGVGRARSDACGALDPQYAIAATSVSREAGRFDLPRDGAGAVCARRRASPPTPLLALTSVLRMHRSVVVLLLSAAIASPAVAQRAQQFSVQSPDAAMTISVEVSDQVRYSVSRGGKSVLDPSPISLTLAGGRVLGRELRVPSRQTQAGARTACGRWRRRRARSSRIGSTSCSCASTATTSRSARTTKESRTAGCWPCRTA